MTERMQDTPEWQGRERTQLDNFQSAINAHKGLLTSELRSSRERLAYIAARAPVNTEAHDLWTEAHMAVRAAEEAMQKAIKATLKLLD